MEQPLPACGWIALAVALGTGVGLVVSILGAVVWSIASALRTEMLGTDPAAAPLRSD